jgi:hypothetical protein
MVTALTHDYLFVQFLSFVLIPPLGYLRHYNFFNAIGKHEVYKGDQSQEEPEIKGFDLCKLKI